MMRYVDFRMYGKLLAGAVVDWKHVPRQLVGLRLLFYLLFFPLFIIVQGVNTFCFAMDDLFFASYRRCRIRQPIFIIGNPRTGTTYLHRLLASDELNFFCFKTWEILFPAIIQKKVLTCLGYIDRVLFKEALGRFVRIMESRLFKDYKKIHPVSLFAPEEDDKLLLHTLRSLDMVWFFPFAEVEKYSRFDEKLGIEEKKRVMNFYRECIKRQAFHSGPGKRFLSKAPASSAKVASLYEFFPDCRIIYTVRNPLEVVPSLLSMTRQIWSAAVDVSKCPELQEKSYAVARYFYHYPLQYLNGMDPRTYVIVNYEDLVAHPLETVQNIYATFGIKPGENVLQMLMKEQRSARTYQSHHRYSLEQFGLTRERILEDFKEVFDRFGFKQS